jgi:fluoride ion exporter CrcB/FEX
MNVLVTSGLVTAIVFLAGIVGLNLQRFLPAAHLSKDTQDVIKLGTGMLSVLASLVLGLLIASVKSSFDSTSSAVRTYA